MTNHVLNIRSRQAGDKWHPGEGIAWTDDLLKVFILTIGKVASLCDKQSTTVEIDDSYP
jgi:ribosomal protein L27